MIFLLFQLQGLQVGQVTIGQGLQVYVGQVRVMGQVTLGHLEHFIGQDGLVGQEGQFEQVAFNSLSESLVQSSVCK